MKREYTIEDFQFLADKLIQNIPDIHIATDVICGFPYETDEEEQIKSDLIEKEKNIKVLQCKMEESENSELKEQKFLLDKQKKELDERMKKIKKQELEEEAKISSIQADLAKQKHELNKLKGTTEQKGGNFYELKYYN